MKKTCQDTFLACLRDLAVTLEKLHISTIWVDPLGPIWSFDVLLLELVWILGLQFELGYCGPSGTGADPEVWAARLRTIFMDNAGALSCLNDVVRHQANKHYRLRLESVKELIAKYCFVLRKVPGSLNPANPLTKMLSGTQAAVEYSWIESDAQPGGHAKK